MILIQLREINCVINLQNHFLCYLLFSTGIVPSNAFVFRVAAKILPYTYYSFIIITIATPAAVIQSIWLLLLLASSLPSILPRDKKKKKSSNDIINRNSLRK